MHQSSQQCDVDTAAAGRLAAGPFAVLAEATAEIDIAVDRNKFAVVADKMDNMKCHDPFDLIDRQTYRNCFDVANVFDNLNNCRRNFAAEQVAGTAADKDSCSAYRKTLTNSSTCCCCSLCIFQS